jgi:hypothetical protein
VQVGVQPITVTVQDADGVYRKHTLREDPIYRQAHDKIIETILLLLFDNQLVEQGMSAQRQQEFE